jgi:hypothetical protein
VRTGRKPKAAKKLSVRALKAMGAYTIKEAATVAKVPVASLRSWITRGILKAKKQGTGLRAPLSIAKADLEQALTTIAKKAAAPKAGKTPKAGKKGRKVPQAPKGHLTLKNAASYAGLSIATIRLWINKGTLPASRLGTGKRAAMVVAKVDVDRLAQERPARGKRVGKQNLRTTAIDSLLRATLTSLLNGIAEIRQELRVIRQALPAKATTARAAAPKAPRKAPRKAASFTAPSTSTPDQDPATSAPTANLPVLQPVAGDQPRQEP